MSYRRRARRRRPSYDAAHAPIIIRVGSRRSHRKFHEIQVVGARDEVRFTRLVGDQVRASPDDPLIININGYQPWLREVIHPCIEDYWSDISDLDREVQFAGTMQFPERASKRGQSVPWTFIIDQINVPQVYYWSVDEEPPRWDDDTSHPDLDRFRFRTGVWTCSRGACRFDKNVPVVIIFTKPTEISEHVVTELMFDYFYQDEDLNQRRQEEQSACWTFFKLYDLLTDWQNIIGEVVARLDEAEANSHGHHLPVKIRTRTLHREVDRLYEMKEYLHFHTRSLKKLQQLKDSVPDNEKNDPLWGDIDDAMDDLGQYDTTLDGLKERFNNLIELEFNITNTNQAENAQFLSTIATLFLPVSFIASVFGITTITWPAIWYLYVAVPVFVVSALFTAIFPWARRRIQKQLYPIQERRLRLQPNQFTMLGDQLPDSVNAAGAKSGRSRHKAQRPSRNDSQRSMRGDKH